MKFDVCISSEVTAAAPGLHVLQIEARINNPHTSDPLWEEVSACAAGISERFALSDIARRPAIAATRAAYKAMGKDPNRYRPAAEQLCRRVVQGKGLYRLTSVVDIINLLSMASGYSIGGFDADRIDGTSLTLGIGREGELYHGIGRGALNIAGLPVYRDITGGIGTPTSDEERTKTSEDTCRLLMLVNMYGEEMSAEEVTERARELLGKYCGTDNSSEGFSWRIIHATEQ